jgi:hypothetical protein
MKKLDLEQAKENTEKADLLLGDDGGLEFAMGDYSSTLKNQSSTQVPLQKYHQNAHTTTAPWIQTLYKIAMLVGKSDLTHFLKNTGQVANEQAVETTQTAVSTIQAINKKITSKNMKAGHDEKHGAIELDSL